RFRTPASSECRARGPQCTGRAGHIWPVRFLPRARFIVFLRWRRIDRVVQPTVPGWRDTRGLRISVVDDPAPFEPERLVDLTAFGPVISVAELIFADGLAIHPGPELGPECLRIPPGEQFEQETFHRCRALKTIGIQGFCHLGTPKSSGGAPRIDRNRPYSP